MHSYIRPNTHIALRLPSGVVKIVEIKPNITINIGKFGTFPSNLLLGRPYYNTYELHETEDGKSTTCTGLRVVPANELHAEALGNEYTPAESREDGPLSTDTNDTPGTGTPADSTSATPKFDIIAEDGTALMRSNRLTIDDPTRQTLSMAEIEALKKSASGSGKDIIAKILASHTAIDEKTSFSLAKYTLRKSRKYLKRFTAFPLDVGMLAECVMEKEGFRCMGLREEGLGLVTAWANVHCAEGSRVVYGQDGVSQIGGGRWLVVDDTGGLVVAALAEKMGILYPEEENDESDEEGERQEQEEEESGQPAPQDQQQGSTAPESKSEATEDTPMTDAPAPTDPPSASQQDRQEDQLDSSETPRTRRNPPPPQSSSLTTTLTVLHPNAQPSLPHLTPFAFDATSPTPSHPLYTHLKCLSWLSLLSPTLDPNYLEPPPIPAPELAALKSSKRGNYYKKRRRWEKTKRVVDEVRRGGYDGLVVATSMDLRGVLRTLVPLVRGGGRVVVWSRDVEPLVEVMDWYSKERRAAYVTRQEALAQTQTPSHPPTTPATPNSAITATDTPTVASATSTNGEPKTEEKDTPSTTPSLFPPLEEEEDEDFPVNPTLLLAPTLQTSRARHWQVLPERTHPMMTSRGGAEGYIFTATRVIPAEGKVEARGKFRGKAKKRKLETGEGKAVGA